MGNFSIRQLKQTAIVSYSGIDTPSTFPARFPLVRYSTFGVISVIPNMELSGLRAILVAVSDGLHKYAASHARKSRKLFQSIRGLGQIM